MVKLLVQVCGDPTVDWLIAGNERQADAGDAWRSPASEESSTVRLSSQAGGSALVLQLLTEMIPPELARVEGRLPDAGLLERPLDGQIATTWTGWRLCEDDGRSRQAFRLCDLGWREQGRWDYEGNRLSGQPDLLVVADSGLGFRSAREGWPEVLQGQAAGNKPEQIILKLNRYGGDRENPLLARLADQGLAARVSVLTSISDLRSCPARIRVSLSWERLFEDVVAAVRSPRNSFVDDQGNLLFQQVIVTVGVSGAVIVGREHDTLIFDRSGQEGDFVRHLTGPVMGADTCVLGALAAAWVERPPGVVDWARATRDGLGLARLLYLDGYQAVVDQERWRLQFPYRRLAKAYRELPLRAGSRSHDQIWDLGIFHDARGLARAGQGTALPSQWSILEETIRESGQTGARITEKSAARGSLTMDAVFECARKIVAEGPAQALPDVPVELIGNWRSADRHEVEGVRSVYNAMADYLTQQHPKTPLSVAVFGSPGAGKSFVVREIARELGIAADAQLTCNLSQLTSPRELTQVFQQIRDWRLRGKMPLVFWEEFDMPCEGVHLGWLRYFLTPMQDGEFSDHGWERPLGGGIYVFSGAARHSFKEFCAGSSGEEAEAKKSDFITRLRAYIDVLGVNGNPNTVEDRMFPVRRAFVLNRCLQAFAPQIKMGDRFPVDRGALDAFLKVNRYRDEARSMVTLIRMSNLHEKRSFALSSLPPDDVLGMHVDAGEFNALTRTGDRELLRVGITGHVWLDPERMAGLEAGVARAVAFIESQFPSHCLTVFSPLAIGADRLVARALLQNKAARLIVVLPVPLEDYLKDFGSTDEHRLDYDGADLRQEFRYWLGERAIETIVMPLTPTRGEAYLRSGRYIVEHSDVMVAVWDGKKAQGRGGTGAIVDLAQKLGKPICHVWAGNCKPDKDRRTDVGDKHGQLRYMNFPGDVSGSWSSE
jgi:hypothetical protein